MRVGQHARDAGRRNIASAQERWTRSLLRTSSTTWDTGNGGWEVRGRFAIAPARVIATGMRGSAMRTGTARRRTRLTALPAAPLSAEGSAAKLDGIRALVAVELDEVNRIILDRMQSEVSLIPELAAPHHRRRRQAGPADAHPALGATVRLSRHAAARRWPPASSSSTPPPCCTTTWSTTAALRRGSATANAVWGNKARVLVGDFLFSRAFQLMVDDGSLRVLEILSSASAVIAEGEVQQLITSNDTATSEAGLSRGHRGQDRRAVPGRLPDRRRRGRTAGGRRDGARRLRRHLGIAFQLIDDALDYSAREALLGKSVGDDFREGKITLPVLLAFARGSDDERAFWRRTLEDLDQRDGDLERAQEMIGRHGAIEATVARAEIYAQRARQSLAPFPYSRAKHAMLDLLDFCTGRAY